MTQEQEELYYHIYIFDAPKQVRSNNELDSLESASEAAEQFILTQFILTVLLNLVLTGTMTYLWNIFNTMQLISALPTFAIKTPSNIQTIHASFDEIVNFEIVSKEELYDWIVVPLLDFTGSRQMFIEEVQTQGDESIQYVDGDGEL